MVASSVQKTWSPIRCYKRKISFGSHCSPHPLLCHCFHRSSQRGTFSVCPETFLSVCVWPVLQDEGKLTTLKEMAKELFNDNQDIRRQWGGGTLSPKRLNIIAKRQRIIAAVCVFTYQYPIRWNRFLRLSSSRKSLQDRKSKSLPCLCLTINHLQINTVLYKPRSPLSVIAFHHLSTCHCSESQFWLGNSKWEAHS